MMDKSPKTNLPRIVARPLARLAVRFLSWGGYSVTKNTGYAHDEMVLPTVSLEFMKKERFVRAYRAGMESGHRYSKLAGTSDADIHLEFRVATALWAAAHCRQLEGDFVECGVYTGIFSLAVCDYIDFNKTGKHFWLFDTFAGHPNDQKDTAERPAYTSEIVEAYSDHYEMTKAKFAKFPNASLIRGSVPDTLPMVPIEKVCYLSIDMNLWKPEVAALDYFWPKLVPGAIVILDDYGRSQFPLLCENEDRWAVAHGVEILTMANGQGLMIKP
jgi:O-methyltransferase